MTAKDIKIGGNLEVKPQKQLKDNVQGISQTVGQSWYMYEQHGQKRIIKNGAKIHYFFQMRTIQRETIGLQFYGTPVRSHRETDFHAKWEWIIVDANVSEGTSESHGV